MGNHSELSHLLSSGRIGTLETRNRIVMAAMGSNLGDGNGFVGERMKRYYETRAQGGAGLIIVEVCSIGYPDGAAIPRQLGISNDGFLPGLRELTDLIHGHGAKAAVQLQHAGKNAVLDIAAGRPLLVPSAPKEAIGGMEDVTEEEMQSMVKNLTTEGAKLHYQVMTAEDISRLVKTFASAAERAKRAGFDGVEIHAGHGYILSSFLSPGSNKRTDQYGGSPENRARILVEVMQAVKKRVGDDFPAWFRMDGREFRIENGITLKDACKTAQIAEEAGADAIHVSAYANPALGHAFTEAPLVHEEGGFLSFAEQIKKAVKIPIIGVGRIEPEVGDRAIGEGKVDFIAMGRKLLADPDLPNKLTSGKQEDIRPCIYCYTCVGKIFLNENACCAANPAMGKEGEFEMIPAAKKKTLLIVGGGPAGMEAARVAALRGHHVTLCEK
jgi:2,4-dienoyl-CoA reductase-like NADH-dependent reductase (Old Yellow Enzyme family)